MSLPPSNAIEMPVLQELVATGGADDVRFLYERLIPYFPQISEKEIFQIKNQDNKSWRRQVQKAGKTLEENNFIRRERGFWTITEKGRSEAANETTGFSLTKTENKTLSHTNIQEMLLEIGEILGFAAQAEFEFYDVVWRESPKSSRLSHVFEVQSKGNLDSAFAKLKRAYIAQRSKPFLVVASESDTRRALQSLNREFFDIQEVVTILSFAELERVHRNLNAIGEILPKLLEV